jgi:hypothetical protein
MVNMMIQSNPALAPYREVVMEWAKQTMTWEALSPKIVKLYTDTFTKQELEEMITFFQTSTGQKVLNTMPELTNKQAMIGAELGRANSDTLRKMITEHAKLIEEKMKQ